MKRIMMLLSALASLTLRAQEVKELNARQVRYPLQKIYRHSGFWITNPEIDIQQYHVILFRKTFSLERKPDSCIIHISADNLYRLYVNGKFICMGPARDDLYHWNYETINIAPFLRNGTNTLAAQVNSFGHDKANAQFTFKTAFLLSAHDSSNAVVNTDDKTWKTTVNRAYRERPVEWMNGKDIINGWYCLNPNDSIIGSDYPWGWQNPGFDDSAWDTPVWLGSPNIRGTGDSGPLLMQPRKVKLLSSSTERFASVVRTEGLNLEGFPFNGKDSLVIPAGLDIVLLIDNKTETMGFPVMTISGGKGSLVRVQYAEALYDSERLKGNRNDIDGKTMIGVYDVYKPDGRNGCVYQPLWYRAFRYIRLEIHTGNTPLVINDFYNLSTHYPFREKAVFECNDPDYAKIWEAGWRTDLICSQDFYMSDAYYETMQYVGDTRVHGLVTAALTGDYSLYRQAILQFDESRISDGLTLAAYPNDWYWIIPYYSLMWVDMVKDYTMLTGDKTLAEQVMPGVRDVLAWFSRHLNDNGLLGKMEWANPNGAPENSTLFSLYYAYSLNNTARVCDGLGYDEEAAAYRKQASAIAGEVNRLSWDDGKKRMAETPEKDRFTQWDDIMAILTDAVPLADQPALLTRVLSPSELPHIDYFQGFYLFEAVKKLGMGNLLFDHMLDPWREQVNEEGLTTFKEINSDRARSDCHPWSTSPLYYMLNITAGIETIGPGYQTVRIAPSPGKLTFVKSAMPIPAGMISVDLKFDTKGGVKGTVTLPEGVSGTFEWKGRTVALREGLTGIHL